MSEDFQLRLKKAYEIHRSGKLDEARRLYREVLAINPHHPDANNLMGLLCIQSKNTVKAIRHIQRALRVDPKRPQAHYNLGVAYKDLRRFSEAANAFSNAVKLDDQNLEYQSSYGNALRLSGRQEDAVQILEESFRKASGNRGLRNNLALAQNDLGAKLIKSNDPGQAVRHFRRAIELAPQHAQAHINLGLTLEQMGQLDEAARQYKTAIRARPDFSDAHFHLAHLRTHTSTDAEIKAMQHLMENPGTVEKDRISLSYGLGFALESAKQYPKAFSYMAQAHRLQEQRSPFDLQATTARFAKIKHVFSSERLAKPEATGPLDERPIFIVGMPRSGTTLAEQVLASHPSVHGRGESEALAHAARFMTAGLPFPDGLEKMSRENLNEAAEAYLIAIGTDAIDATRITDTTPMNFQFTGFAAMMLPNARFVFCSRNPMDNCLSLYRQMLTGANEFAHTLENLGGYFGLHQDLLDHWASALNGRVFQLKYEDLVRDNENQVRELLEFCGLPFDQRSLKFHELDRMVRSPSAAQVRQPVYETSIDAWKRYEVELAPLREALTARNCARELD